MTMNWQEAAEFLATNLRLRSFPIGVKFLRDVSSFPEKTRRPSEAMQKRITICQGVTLARIYGWTVGLAKQDLICVPAMIAFGFTKASKQADTLGKLFCKVGFSMDDESGQTESGSMSLLDSGEGGAICLAPLSKDLFEPDTVVVYGNPAQVMRMIQASAYSGGARVPGNFGGKVECTEYLIAPFKSGTPRVAIPGNGDRVFSMTQDDEMVYSFPGHFTEKLVQGLQEAGKRLGARYPVAFYQNFQPEFPKIYKTIGDEVGAF
jgi:uncharacterized protein (DUF169 family)